MSSFNDFSSLKPIYKESYPKKGKKPMFEKLRKRMMKGEKADDGITEEKLKKTMRKTTGQKEPFQRPPLGSEEQRPELERMRKEIERRRAQKEADGYEAYEDGGIEESNNEITDKVSALQQMLSLPEDMLSEEELKLKRSIQKQEEMKKKGFDPYKI